MKKIMSKKLIIPQEIQEKIYYYYITLYMSKMEKVHQELLQTDPILNLSETFVDFEVEYEWACRLPRLI